MLNILTIDVEDYYHVSAFESTVNRKDWDKYESRVVNNTRRLLVILKSFNVKATFFILGWVAERYPEIIRDIAFEGHEVASHGYAHKLIYNQSQESFREDILRSKAILEEIISDTDQSLEKRVIGYRAPSYSITKRSLWALDILVEEGFQYDSSIYPVSHDFGGIPSAERFPYVISCDNGGSLWEFPLSTLRIMRTNIPIAGGGYFRLFPYEFTRWAIKKLNKNGQSAIVYIHPWEIDPSQPKLNGNIISRFRQYNNLDKTEKRFKALLHDFDFVPIRTFLQAEEEVSPHTAQLKGENLSHPYGLT